MRIAVINSSSEVYNLAVHKIAHYHERLGDQVTIVEGGSLFIPGVWDADKVYFSCIFTWNLPDMVGLVNTMKNHVPDIEIGGPAATAMPEYIIENTGIVPHTGLDIRFEFVSADDYKMIFTSRGCPRACEFCLVQKVEGRKMIEYSDFPIPVGDNPWIGDNNILSTSWEHQLLVADKLRDVRNLDINSGFDDRIFAHNPEKYWDLYSKLHLERWRFAYDSPDQREVIKSCVDFLHSKGVRYSAISVFCLVGWPGTTFEEAREKLQYLVDIGCSPYPMRYRPLDALRRDYVPPGWNNSHELDLLFHYYAVPWYWKTVKWEDFREDHKELNEQKEMLFDRDHYLRNNNV